VPRITPVLWFDGEAEAAATFYVSLFPGSSVTDVSRYPDDFPDPALAGRALVVEFELDGQGFQGLNGGPGHAPSDAVSFSVPVSDQPELDRLWDALVADGGEEGRCGWLTDRWGFSWQIVPSALGETLGGPDREGAARAMAAMMGMGRLVVDDLRAAYAGT
jgi:predicted 3-demethylubiquinone-9 3-methyltransferase (glyoxalase superfamily)